MKVACITRFDDFYPVGGLSHRVAEEFSKRGYEYVKINPDDISIAYDQGAFPLSHPDVDFEQFDLFDHVLRYDDAHGQEVVECLREWNKICYVLIDLRWEIRQQWHDYLREITLKRQRLRC